MAKPRDCAEAVDAWFAKRNCRICGRVVICTDPNCPADSHTHEECAKQLQDSNRANRIFDSMVIGVQN